MTAVKSKAPLPQRRRLLERCDAALGDPRLLRRVHGWLTLIWFVGAFPICWFFSESIKLLVFVSVYANVVGHWSSWQASRVEVKQDNSSE